MYLSNGPTVIQDEVVNGERVRVIGDGHQDMLDVIVPLHFVGIPTVLTFSLPMFWNNMNDTLRTNDDGSAYSTRVCSQEGAINYTNGSVTHLAPTHDRTTVEVVMGQRSVLEENSRIFDLYNTQTTTFYNTGFQIDTTVTSRHEATLPTISWGESWIPQLESNGYVNYTTETKEFTDITKIERSSRDYYRHRKHEEPEIFEPNENGKRSYSGTDSTVVDHEITYKQSFFGSYSREETSTETWECSANDGDNSNTRTFQSSSSTEGLRFNTASTTRSTGSGKGNGESSTSSGAIFYRTSEQGRETVTNHDNRGSCTHTRSSNIHQAVRKQFSDGSYSETGVESNVDSTTTRTPSRISVQTRVEETYYQLDGHETLAGSDVTTPRQGMGSGEKKVTARMEKTIESETEKGFFMNSTKETTKTKNLDTGEDVGEPTTLSVSKLNSRSAKGMSAALSATLTLLKKYSVDGEAATLDDALQLLGVTSEGLAQGQLAEVVDNFLSKVNDKSQSELMAGFGVVFVALSCYRNYRESSTLARVMAKATQTQGEEDISGYQVKLLEHENEPVIFVSDADVKANKLVHDNSMFVGRSVGVTEGRTGIIQKHQFTMSPQNDLYTLKLTSKDNHGVIISDIKEADLHLLENLEDELQPNDYVRYYSTQKQKEGVCNVALDTVSAMGQSLVVYVSDDMSKGSMLIGGLQFLITAARLGIKYHNGEMTFAGWASATGMSTLSNIVNVAGGLGGGAVLSYMWGPIAHPVAALAAGVGVSFLGSLALTYTAKKTYSLLERQLYWQAYRRCARGCGLLVGALGYASNGDSMWINVPGVQVAFTDKDIATRLRYRRFKCSSDRGKWNGARTEKTSQEKAVVLSRSWAFFTCWSTYTLSFNGGKDIWYDVPHSQIFQARDFPYDVGDKITMRFKHSDELDLQTMQEFERLCHYRHYFGQSELHKDGKLTLFAYLMTTVKNMISRVDPEATSTDAATVDTQCEDPFDETVWKEKLKALNGELVSPQSYFANGGSVTSDVDRAVLDIAATNRQQNAAFMGYINGVD